ncbi:MAG: hypothetical protein FWG63_01660 [Defluviitaleaceae bacterium]|nr:hypothetical protein [Defluviitaleaceae bacterium]
MGFFIEYIRLVTSVYYISSVLSGIFFVLLSYKYRLAERLYTALRIINKPLLRIACNIILVITAFSLSNQAIDYVYYATDNGIFADFVGGIILGFLMGGFLATEK